MDSTSFTPWLLSLHIVALVFWCGGQLLLPVLIRGLRTSDTPALQRAQLPDETMSMPRFVFTRIATPAAILAIASGTGVFLLNHTLEVWLLLKLALVAALVAAHTLGGWLLLRAPRLTERQLTAFSGTLLLASALLMIAIVWTVLYKPLAGWL